MMKIILTYILCIASIILSGCGGGGSSSENSTPVTKATFTTLVNLANGQGVALGNELDGGITALVFSHDIAGIVASANKTSTTGESGIQNITPTNFPIISTTPTTTTRRGTLASDSATLNLTILQNNQISNAAGIYIETPGYSDFLMVVGEKLADVPVSGTYTYYGTFTQNARSVVAPGEIGTFGIAVDFTTKLFTIKGTTANMAFQGSGSIDLKSGLFASSNISIGVRGVSYVGTVYGNLNGKSATGITGVFFTNDSIPDYSGTFFGKR